MGTLDINRLNKFFCKKVFVETNDRGKTFPYLSSLNHNFMLKSCFCIRPYPTNIYLFKFNNISTKKIWSELTIKTTRYFFSVYIVEFKQVNVCWVFMNGNITPPLEVQCLEAYSEYCQISKMVRFAKIINGWKPLTIFWQNVPSQMFIIVLNTTVMLIRGL